MLAAAELLVERNCIDSARAKPISYTCFRHSSLLQGVLLIGSPPVSSCVGSRTRSHRRLRLALEGEDIAEHAVVTGEPSLGGVVVRDEKFARRQDCESFGAVLAVAIGQT